MRTKAVLLAFEYPGVRMLIVRRTYKAIDGTQLAPWREYVEAMAEYQGSKGAGLDAKAPKGAIPFEEYAFADVFADDSDVKYSIRSFADGSQFVHVDTEQERFEGLTGNELRKAAHEYLIQNFRGKVAGTIVRAYVTGVSERKLLYPNKTQNMRIIEAISKAVPELGNLLDASKLLSSGPDSATHAHGDKVIGWRKYRTVFEVGGMFIEGTTNIQITQHGDVYYGMSKLKDITDSPTVQAYLSEGDRTSDNASDPNISRPDDSVKHSLRLIDDQHRKAYEAGDESIARGLVQEAAIAAGYNPQKLYHGTNVFGFTKIDPSKADDGISFFTSTAEQIAKTYVSDDARVRRVSEDGSTSVDQLLNADGEKLLSLLHKHYNENYELTSKEEVRELANDEGVLIRKRIIPKVEQLLDAVRERNEEWGLGTETEAQTITAYEAVIDALDRLSYAKSYDLLERLYAAYNDALTRLGEIDSGEASRALPAQRAVPPRSRTPPMLRVCASPNPGTASRWSSGCA